MTFQNRLALLLLAGGLLVLTGCQSPQDKNHTEVLRIAAEHERYMSQWNAEQLRFERDNPMPKTIDFGTNGTLILQEAVLVGLRGSEKLHVRFTFVNTTGVSIESAVVRLMLIDRQRELEWGEVMNLRLPFGFALTHNSSYTGFFEVPLEGLYRSPGWDWRIEVTSADRDVPPGVDPG